MEREELLRIIDDKVNDIFLAYQEAEDIESGDITPEEQMRLDAIIENLCDCVIESMEKNLPYPEKKIAPVMLSRAGWTVTDGGFPVLADRTNTDRTITIEFPSTANDDNDYHAEVLVKVGYWGEHDILRKLHLDVSIDRDYADFYYDDDYFFDFEYLHGDFEKFEKLQDILSEVWTKEFDKMVDYTNEHMDRAVELMMEQIEKSSGFPELYGIIKDMSERGRAGYDHRPDLVKEPEEAERE